MWFCYILRNRDPRYRNMTYNGSTNDPIRRLRQHNEEISGGAKATHGKAGAWEIYVLLSGFETHVNALSCEWLIKHPSGKPGKRPAHHCGVGGRVKAMNDVLPVPRWTSKCTIENKDVAYVLHIAQDVAHLLDRSIIPDNIEVIVVPCITKELIKERMSQDTDKDKDVVLETKNKILETKIPASSNEITACTNENGQIGI